MNPYEAPKTPPEDAGRSALLRPIVEFLRSAGWLWGTICCIGFVMLLLSLFVVPLFDE